ncbi:hypothetical protein SRABI106_03463 [Rahnella aquatilis]|nr:hypothetical protein SRABI106_03463 [Rahnella aquatilis]
MRFSTCRQTLACGVIEQRITVFEEESAPLLLTLCVHRALYLTQFRQRLQMLQPVSSGLNTGSRRRTDQPHKLAIQTLSKAVRKSLRNIRFLLLRQQRQNAAVNLAAWQ